MESYKQSKLCNILFTNQLQIPLVQNAKTESSHIQVFSVSPGIVLTNLGRDRLKRPFYKLVFLICYPLIWFLLKTPKQGAECVIYCCIKPNLKPTSGYYFRNCKQIKLKEHAYNLEESRRLWIMSEKMVEKWF